jgi:hypothetical protein
VLVYAILGLALLAGVLLAGKWYVETDARTLLKASQWGLLGLIIVIVLFFVFSGRLAWALATLPALMPWFFRLRMAVRVARMFSRRGGQKSQNQHRYRRRGAGGGGGAGTGMDRDRALKILGLEESATKTDIKAAHRRLIADVHPDHGGSDYLAAQINQARDVLLAD